MKKPTNLQDLLYDAKDLYAEQKDMESKEFESKKTSSSTEDIEKLNQVKGELKSLETEVLNLLLRILDEQVPLFSSDRLKTLHSDCRELLNRVGRKGMIDYRHKLIETVNILKLVNWNLLQMDNKHLDDHEFLINATKEYVKNMEDFLKGDL